MADDAPETMEVPSRDVGRIIGPNGSTLRRLVSATGCKIEIPKRTAQDDAEAPVTVSLLGGPVQRRRAAEALRDIVAGGDFEDHAARADGALVVVHGFEDFERRSWLAWRLVPAEHEHGIRVDMGRGAVRVWKADKGPALTGQRAAAVRAAIEKALAEARELVELNVDVPIANEPENICYDPTVRALVDQYGVLVRLKEAEEESRPVRVWGPAEAARDAALLVEAKWVKGRTTSGLLQAPGQVQASIEVLNNDDFANDLRSLEAEADPPMKVTMGHTIIWMSGSNAEAVAAGKETLRQMLQWYWPDAFAYNQDLGTPDFVDLLRQDPMLRSLACRPEGAMYLDSRERTGWLCGSPEYRKPIESRVEALQKKWASEHWEMDLDNYGVAMWLLGPGGTGGWVQRMQTDCGATIRVEPNSLKVKVEGKPRNVEEGKKLVLEAIEKLEEKRKAEEDISVKDVATKRAKKVLSEHPPHMQAILDSLRLLEARETEMKRRAKMREWDLERPAPAAPAEPQPAVDSAGSSSAEPETGRVASEKQREDWDMLRDVRKKVSEAALKPQLLPEVEPRSAGIGRILPGVPLDAVLREQEEAGGEPDGVVDDAV